MAQMLSCLWASDSPVGSCGSELGVQLSRVALAQGLHEVAVKGWVIQGSACDLGPASKAAHSRGWKLVPAVGLGGWPLCTYRAGRCP